MRSFKCIIGVLLAAAVLSTPVMAHSGRTDSQGGHRDNQNASGLGSYHYHHGYGPHLHPNGVCPYAAPAANTTSIASSAPPAPATTTQEPAVGEDEKAEFLDTYIAIIQSGQSDYHRLDCENLDITQGFLAYNITAAQSEGYTPCTKCQPQS